MDIPRSEKWKIFRMLLLLEMAIIFIIVFPIYYLVNWITPLREVEFIEDLTLVKSLIFLVFLIPFLEEVLFRLKLRYSGLVEAIISRGFWDRIFPYLVYCLALIFGLLHVTNYANSDLLFYVFAPLLVISQLIGGFVMSYLRVHLNFWWAVYSILAGTYICRVVNIN